MLEQVVALVWYLCSEEPGISAVVFHPGLIRSDLLGRQALPLRLLGSVANRFARSTCPVAEHLASRTADLDHRGVQAHGEHGSADRSDHWAVTGTT